MTKLIDAVPALREIKSKCPTAYETILEALKTEYAIQLKYVVENKDDSRFFQGSAYSFKALLLFWLDGRENETIPLM